MKHRTRLLALLMSVFVTIPLLTGFATASSAADAPTMKAEDHVSEEEPFVLPDIVEQAEAEENQYVGRLKNKETNLHTFVFANADGSHTMRVYRHPVKYVDAQGEVRDITLKIARQKSGKLIAVSHAVDISFEKKLSDGISLKYQDTDIRMVPVGIADAVLTGEETVSYAIDENTSYEYTLTYAGFKEDIVVKNYTGQTEYTFRLYTGGLSLVQRAGSHVLVDEDGTIKASIGDIIVFTADERNNTMGEMTYQVISDKEEYLITIHLEDAYLKDEKTAYPIRIDPTIEVDTTSGTGAIEDITLNSNDTSVGNSWSLFVGLRETYGISRALMRFPNLDLSHIGFSGHITDAYVEIRDLLCQSNENMTIECHIYNKNSPSWSESANSSWADVGSSYVGALLDSKLVTLSNGNTEDDAQRYRFDIFDAAIAWVDGTQNPAKGLVFKATTAFENQTGSSINYWYKTFSSYNRSSYQPSLTITYQNQMTVNDLALTLDVGETYTLSAACTPSNYTIRWHSRNTRIATVNYTTGLVTAKAPGQIGIFVYCLEDASINAVITLTVNPPTTQTSGIESGAVYMIKNKSKNQYLHAVSAESVALRNSDPMDGRQLWYVEWAGNGYRLYSLGVKDQASYGEYETVLRANTANLSPTVHPQSYSQTLWSISGNSTSGYYLTNTQYDHLSVSANSADTTVKCASLDAETTYAKWSFEKIETSTFNNYHSGSYIGQGDIVYVKVEINDKVYENNIINESHFDAIDYWKNRSSKVVVYGPDDVVPSGITPFVVTIIGNTQLGSTFGATAGMANNSIALFGSNWNEAIIFLNTTLDLSGSNPIVSPLASLSGSTVIPNTVLIEKVIIHEMGHALKLAHPFDSDQLENVVDGRGAYTNDNKVCAVMNQGYPYNNSILTCETPKIHDIINLRNKWE